MSARPPHDDENEVSVWNRKSFIGGSALYSVIVAHADTSVAESIALLLRLKGFAAVVAVDLDSLALMLGHWTPDALLIETRLCRANDFEFVRQAAQHKRLRTIFFVALTDIHVVEQPQSMRSSGFDGLCRKPCPVWRLADMLRQTIPT